jgi:translation initiation factor 1
MQKSSRAVYSTEVGRICPDCAQAINSCACDAHRKHVVKGDGRVRVALETKGRKGKGVTLITGLPLTAEQLNVLGKQLKQLCGTGGTVKDGVIEIQGDHRDRLVDVLSKQGYQAKKSGG